MIRPSRQQLPELPPASLPFSLLVAHLALAVLHTIAPLSIVHASFFPSQNSLAFSLIVLETTSVDLIVAWPSHFTLSVHHIVTELSLVHDAIFSLESSLSTAFVILETALIDRAVRPCKFPLPIDLVMLIVALIA